MLQGLTTEQIEKLHKEHGLNTIEDQKKNSIFRVFFEQLNNFLTILLIIAASVSFFVGETVDGSLIIAIVILNALFGIYQEYKASQAIAALKQMTITRVRVIRDGVEQEVDSRELVPGDIVFIEEGVKVPADGKVVETVNLEINEAALTGESLPVEKNLHDEISMGTIVTKGRGYAQITATGMKTKFGQIASHLAAIEESKTPLQKKLESLSKLIGVIGITASLVVFFLSSGQGETYFTSFILAVSLAVAVVPEGLPAVMTITLSIGVKEMAKKKAIMRKLSAIEALGSVTLIATDKTGTLTTNKMRVKEVFVSDQMFAEDKLPALSNHPFSRLVLNGVLCSTASLVKVHDHGSFDVLGDPTEGALLYMARKVGLIPEMVRSEWKLVEEVPFDSITKRMSVIVNNEKNNWMFTKGAPESIIELCDSILLGDQEEDMTSEKRKKIEKVMGEWAKKGLRVLAFSRLKIPSSTDAHERGKKLKKGDYYEKHTFLGLVAIHDPPRLEAREAVARAHKAGIKVVMITGDNEKTAEAIATQTGLIEEGGEILTGKQLESYSDAELLKLLPKVRVFARTTPIHKSRIVSLYQKLGEIVAVTGDGVNDAVALKQADVGVAMGLVGTDVARETADMVITDDNFSTIVNAIEEGRNIIKNLRNTIKYLLACNVSEALSIIVGLSLGISHIFYAIQLLYINLVTDGVPALALAFAPREENAMARPPDKKLSLLNVFDIKYIFAIGIFATFVVIAAYFRFDRLGDVFGRTGAFTMLALIQSFIFIDLWLSHRSLIRHFHKLKSLIFVVAFIMPFILQYIVVRSRIISSIFKAVPITGVNYLELVLVSSFILVAARAMTVFLHNFSKGK